jgi:hypothetical protein
MIATSYLATLLSFRRPQACGHYRAGSEQIIYDDVLNVADNTEAENLYCSSHGSLETARAF